MADVGTWGPWTDERVERLRSLAAEGLSCRQIAKAFGDGTSRNSVLGKMARLGIPNQSSLGARPDRKPPAVKHPRHCQRAKNPHARPPRIVPELPTIAPAASVHWLERRFGQCAWPVSGMGADTVSCGKAVEPDRPYCPAHCAQAYVPPKNSGRELARGLRRYTSG